MRICHYNDNRAGAVIGDQVYPIGDALLKTGQLPPRCTMIAVIETLVNEPANTTPTRLRFVPHARYSAGPQACYNPRP